MTIEYKMDLIQNTDEWARARTGMITASCAKNIITPTGKTANNEGSRKYSYQLAVERMYGYQEDSFQSYDMERGHIEEIYAKELYSREFSQTKDCGFVINRELGFEFGFSPDALVGEDGLVEVKSRKEKLQIETIINNKMPSGYNLQIQAGLFVTGRKWCDFLSYSNGMPMYIERIYPDADLIEKIKQAAIEFDIKTKEVIDDFKEKTKSLPVAKRRDYETGTEIKPSNNTDVLMAG